MPSSSAVPNYSAIYAFGDSLSDAGNLSIVTSIAFATQPVSPPYYGEQYGPIAGNVFSNGPTWVQDLSFALGLGTLEPSLTGGGDFAYGGAETGSTPQNASDVVTKALFLPAQITQFQIEVPKPSANALYTLSIGANDLLDILGTSGLTAQQQTTDVNDAVANEISFVTKLVGDGAKNLLVMDVPDLGKTPDVTEGLVNGSNSPSAALDAEASQLASSYNADLTSQLATIASSGAVNVSVLDAYSLLDNAIANPAAYGLTNVTSPVWSGNFSSSSSGTLAATTTAAQDQYLFFDKLHPTVTGQQALAATGLADLSGGTNLHGSAAQYVVADDGGSLYIQDTVAGRDGTQVLPGVTTMAFANGTGVFDPTGAAEDVARLYQTVLDRAPDVPGLLDWTAVVDDSVVSPGVVTATVANAFVTSPEFIKDYGSLSNSAFVNQLYENGLGRAADPTEAQPWDNMLAAGTSRGSVALDIAESTESQNYSLATAGDNNGAEIYRLYETAFGVAPDPTGLATYESVLAGGGTITQVAQDLVGTAGFKQDYGTMSVSQFLTTLYQNALHRAPDAAGLQYWTSQSQAGASQASLLVGFSDSLESRALTASATHANWVFIPGTS
jgi:phospholipase/lecithinase/hemolysin